MAAAAAGWQVVLVDKNKPGLNRLYDRIDALQGAAPVMQCLDLAEFTPQVGEQLINALLSGPGRLDALVHCAAAFDGLQPLEHVSPDVWLRQVQVNLSVPWLLSKQCLPMLRTSGHSSLIFITEDLPTVSGANWGCYGICKSAIDVMAGQFAGELAGSGVNVWAINPGPMQSQLRARAWHSESPATLPRPSVAAERILQLISGAATAPSGPIDLREK